MPVYMSGGKVVKRGSGILKSSSTDDTQSNYRYLNPAATGLNNGSSWTNAWTSFSSATNSAMGTGGVLWVAGGEYGTVDISSWVGTSANRKILRKATVAWHGTSAGWNDSFDTQVRFTGAGLDATQSTRSLDMDGCQYVTIDGQVRSGLESGHGIKIGNSYYGIHCDGGGSNGLTIRYCEIYAPSGHGFNQKEDGIQGKGDDLTIEYCYFHDCQGDDGSHPDGIQMFEGNNATIRYNVFKNCGQFFILGDTPPFANVFTGTVQIYYNLFYNDGVNTGSGGSWVDGDHYDCFCFKVHENPASPCNVFFYNNTVDARYSDVAQARILVIGEDIGAGGRPDFHVTFKNNAIIDTDVDGVTIGTHTFNAYDNSGTATCISIPTETGRVVAASLGFVGGAHPTTSAGFVPAGGSPLLAAGTNVGLSVDINGNAVPATPDIGCFQVS